MKHTNNFDALRLFAATIVIFSHAFLLAQGNQSGEPLLELTGQAVLGVTGVFVFFIISGFLVTASFEATGSTSRFLLKRALRIFPGLWVCLVLCSFVLGPGITTLPIRDYLQTPETWRFFFHNALLEVSVNTLPGVKFTELPDGWNVNGPLWSLPFEAMMYVMVTVLGVLGLLRWPVLAGLVALGVGCAFVDTMRWGNLVHGFLWLVGYFAFGMLAFRLRGSLLLDRWPEDRRLAALAVAGLVVSARFGMLNALFPIFGGFLVLHLALDPRLPVLKAARFGDLSYGLYIYGWPVEQTVAHLAHGKLLWWQLFLIAWPVTAVIAALSWHVVERPALRFKPAARGKSDLPQ